MVLIGAGTVLGVAQAVLVAMRPGEGILRGAGGLVVGLLIVAAINSVLLWYYTRPGVKAWFTRPALEAPPAAAAPR